MQQHQFPIAGERSNAVVAKLFKVLGDEISTGKGKNTLKRQQKVPRKAHRYQWVAGVRLQNYVPN
jgi:hypothetical protein